MRLAATWAAAARGGARADGGLNIGGGLSGLLRRGTGPGRGLCGRGHGDGRGPVSGCCAHHGRSPGARHGRGEAGTPIVAEAMLVSRQVRPRPAPLGLSRHRVASRVLPRPRARRSVTGSRHPRDGGAMGPCILAGPSCDKRVDVPLFTRSGPAPASARFFGQATGVLNPRDGGLYLDLFLGRFSTASRPSTCSASEAEPPPRRRTGIRLCAAKTLGILRFSLYRTRRYVICTECWKDLKN